MKKNSLAGEMSIISLILIILSKYDVWNIDLWTCIVKGDKLLLIKKRCVVGLECQPPIVQVFISIHVHDNNACRFKTDSLLTSDHIWQNKLNVIQRIL
jgi:hypothetical protein